MKNRPWHKSLLATCLTILAIGVSIPVTTAKNDNSTSNKKESSSIYEIFRHPETKYHPYVRWWWNGGHQSKAEITREIELLYQAGIGGVEINPIQLPAGDTAGYPIHEWLSDDWIELVQTAVAECNKRGMVTDIIVGSGWPYGAEFLPRDQQLQMLTVETFNLKGGSSLVLKRDEFLNNLKLHIGSAYDHPLKELLYLRLMPKHIDHFTEGQNLDSLASQEQIIIEAPEGEDYVLYCLVKVTGYMRVINGAPGAAGPVLNHFDRTAVEQFLNRMSDRMNSKMGKMGAGNLRAAFTDSFELEGANWDNDMLEEFERRRGYSLSPYLPYLIFKAGHMGNPISEKYGSEISPEVEQTIARVRNDFDLTQRELFEENFTIPYNNWCHRNDLLSRVQAYGRGLHPLEASMEIDIPECETWHGHHHGHNFPDNTMAGRGYTPVNKYVSSAAHLSGKPIISCEELTNTGWVFSSPLDKLKLTGDLSNLTGVTHSIFHGFNYSPKEVAFPGWIRYGTFFNERNTWWPYLHFWMDYKARLSALFQNSEQQADIAILSPFEDLWSVYGAQREPFPMVTYPQYVNTLWEAIHQNGSGCDYISENILTKGVVKRGALHYGNRSYKTILLPEVESIRPEAAKALQKFVAAGGKVICIGKVPHKSVGLNNAQVNDSHVQIIISQLKNRYPERFVLVKAPDGSQPMWQWYQELQKQQQLTPYVLINTPCHTLSQNFYKHDDLDIFFFVNYDSDHNRTVHLDFKLPQLQNKTAWLWDPETGNRQRISGWANDTMSLYLGINQSRLIVFENASPRDDQAAIVNVALPEYGNRTPVQTISSVWDVTMTHALTGHRDTIQLDTLVDFNILPLPALRHFTGTIDYATSIDIADPAAITILDAGTTHNGITELFINGTPAGVKWYGNRIFNIQGLLKPGANEITIRITTTLGNYCKSLGTSNPFTYTWTKNQPYLPLGLEGPITLY